MALYAWFIPIVDINQVESAEALAKSLKRVKTCGKIVALVSRKILCETEYDFENTFELVAITSSLETKGTPLKSTELISVFLKLTTFSKAIALHPQLVFVNQSDHLFDSFSEKIGLLLTDNAETTVGIGLRPGTIASADEILKPDLENWNVIKIDNWSKFEESGDSNITPDIVLVPGQNQENFVAEFGNFESISWNPMERNWIAVVGMACRFPGANSLDEYWDILKNGKCTSGTLPQGRKIYCQNKICSEAHGNFLKCSVDQFDAQFFKMSPAEAIFTDPQARLLLEVSWEAFENAALNPGNLRGTDTGIFHGSWLQEYKEALNEDSGNLAKSDFLRKYLGNSFGSTATKLSHFYGFTGPNVATESSCSSAMVGVHLACQSLLSRESCVALATGTNLILQMDDKQKVLWAEDGISKTFDSEANGYGRSEGVAVLILKRYSDALRDKDKIHGVILGSAVAQEGLTRSFGQPTVENEAKVMKMALQNAGVKPENVNYLEAHATGTKVGDPIEAEAICRAYQGKRTKPLWIGSGKTNIGHTESVSGLAGIIKVLLALKNEEIPKHLHLNRINQQINFDPIMGKIPTENVKWPRNEKSGKQRIVGVSSFGITGTDVHMILQEAPKIALKESKFCSNFAQEILAVSTKSQIALEDLLTQYENFLSPENISDACFTANTGRSHNLGFRSVQVFSKFAEPIQHFKSSEVKNSPKICFTYPGLVGTMDFTQAKQLYEICSAFQNYMNYCNKIWQQKICKSSSLLQILNKTWNNEESKPHGWYACVLAIQYSLTKLWMFWGVKPDILMGLCMGEVVTAVVSKTISLEAGFKILQTSEYLTEENKKCPGAMLAMKCGLSTCQKIIEQVQQQNRHAQIDVATINAPSQTVVATTPEVIPILKEICVKESIKCQQLCIEFAAHSPFVENALEKAEREIYRDIQHAEGRIPNISSLTGEILNWENFSSKYWRNLFRQPVQYMKACKTAEAVGCTVYLEMGLGAALTTITQDNLDGNTNSLCLSSLAKPKAESGCCEIISSLGKLYLSGVNINWHRFYENQPRSKIDLPHYPFQRKSFWFKKRENNREVYIPGKGCSGSLDGINNTLLGNEIANCTGKVIYSSVICKETFFWLYDHKIGNQTVFPAAGYVELMLSAVKTKYFESDFKPLKLINLKIHLPFLLSKSGNQMQTLVWPQQDQTTKLFTAEVHCRQENSSNWNLHASATIMGDEIGEVKSFRKLENAQFTTEMDTFYNAMFETGLCYGPNFMPIRKVQLGSEESLFLLKMPENMDHFVCHPILMDAMIQAFIVHKFAGQLDALHVPVHIGKFILFQRTFPDNLIYIRCNKNTVFLVNSDETVTAILQNVQLAKTSVGAILKASEAQENKNPEQFSSKIHNIVWQPSQNLHDIKNFTKNGKSENAKTWIMFAGEGSKFNKNWYTIFVDKMIEMDKQVLMVPITQIVENFSVVQKYFEEEHVEGAIYSCLDLETQYKPCSSKSVLEPLLLISQQLIKLKRTNTGFLNFHLITNNCWNNLDMENTEATNFQESLAGLLWGFMRTFRMEQPKILSKSIGLSSSNIGAENLENLILEIFSMDNETEICYRNSTRYSRRLLKSFENESSSSVAISNIGMDTRFTVEFPKSKTLSDVHYVSCQTSEPLLDNEIDIEVYYSSLNFKDVLSIIASNPVFEKMQMRGLDYSGIITRVGRNVKNWSVGDPVFGINFNEKIVTSHTRVNQSLLTKTPDRLTFSEAAALPTVFITAYYCMVSVANLKRGQTILIHAASGGVGLMAIQIAKMLGVRVVATAGNARKRAYLKYLGIQHVFNSRNLEFQKNTEQHLGKRRVDMVLNCLTGPGFKEASLELVCDDGHFVEISKLDVWTKTEVKMRRPLVNYEIVNAMDFSKLLYQQLIQKLVELLTFDKIKPLPCSVYPATEIVSALKYLQKAQHIGKVVLEMPGYLNKNGLFNDRSSYFISGGTGAIGLAVAEWMASQGARYIILGSRSIPNETVQRTIHEIENKWNCQVISRQLDISNYLQCKQFFQEICNSLNVPPLRGIHHCAGLLSDKLIQNQTWKNFEKVLSPKVEGAYNLHKLSIEINLNLEFFVLYSSMCGTFGNIGQANYTAANVYMDALAEQRKYLGLPALSINWGQWDKGIVENVEVKILQPFTVEEGIQTLEKLMSKNRSTSGSGTAVAGNFKKRELLNMAPYFETTLLQHLSSPKYKTEVKPEFSKTKKAVLENTKLKTLQESILKNNLEENQLALITEHVVSALCKTLGIENSEIKENTAFSDMGMDSLMSIEYTNLLLAPFENISASSIDIDKDSTVAGICQQLLTLLQKL